MCNFKSAIIFKNRVVLAPIYNESHSALLKNLKIRDSSENGGHVFVRAELIPPNGDRIIPVDNWHFCVDQDITPEWFDINKSYYESEMRKSVKEWIDKNTIAAAGYLWEKMKENEYGKYYIMSGIYKNMRFGPNNNFADSDILKDLDKSKLLCDLKNQFGDYLLPITTDLTSLDGFRTYGKISGHYLSIPTQAMIMECGDKISCVNDQWWLATPDQTSERGDLSCVRIVGSSSGCSYKHCDWYNNGVRPFFILKK